MVHGGISPAKDLFRKHHFAAVTTRLPPRTGRPELKPALGEMWEGALAELARFEALAAALAAATPPSHTKPPLIPLGTVLQGLFWQAEKRRTNRFCQTRAPMHLDLRGLRSKGPPGFFPNIKVEGHLQGADLDYASKAIEKARAITKRLMSQKMADVWSSQLQAPVLAETKAEVVKQIAGVLAAEALHEGAGAGEVVRAPLRRPRPALRSLSLRPWAWQARSNKRSQKNWGRADGGSRSSLS